MASARSTLPLVASLASFVALAGCGGTTTTINVDLSVQGAEVDGGKPGDAAVRMDLGPCGGPCTGDTPFCDVQSNKCIACRNDNDCAGGNVCRAGACMNGCTPQHGCGDAGVCEADAGACVECTGDNDCARLGDPKRAVCNQAAGRCVACLPKNDKCAGGTYCGDSGGGVFACLPGCKDSFECQIADGGGAGSACCNHACVDTNTSAKACGGCGIDCNGGACCGGKCANVTNDNKNCGTCGKVCVAANAAPTCNNGVCGVGACLPGFADCNGNANDGCEANVQGDTNNCGGCGNRCALPNANALCLAGACTIGGCNAGWKNCDGLAQNGCEQDIANDPKNCGTCGNDCGQLPHATASCKVGACAVGACAPGFGNCDKNDGNGCEAQLSADPLNCGGCGMACPSPPHVIASCTNGVCGAGVCAPGWVDCNKNMNDGCEAQVAVDANNCGLCGNVCPAGPNAVGACAMGACTFACNAGFLDCNNNKADGCEVNGNTNASNCGKCGTVCANGQTCSGGVCIAAQQWVFANYNNMAQTMWDPAKMWNGTINCVTTCNFLGQRAIGARFICNLWGQGATEGCNAMNDGQPGNANCGHYIDNGVALNLNGNSEDCAGNIAACLNGNCGESVTYHALQCQCGP